MAISVDDRRGALAPWCRAAAAALAAVTAAGCSAVPGAPAHAASPHPRTAVTAPPPVRVTPATPAAGLPVPGCSTTVAASPALSRVHPVITRVPGSPFGVAGSPDGRWTFVALATPGGAGPGNGVGVFRNRGAGGPARVRTVGTGQGQPLGLALSRDGRYLLAADGLGGATVIDARRAEQGRPGAVLGTLSDPQGQGAIEAAVSPDDRFAFVSLEGSQAVAVFSLQRALHGGSGPGRFLGAIPVGLAPVGLAISPDGRWLYAASEYRDTRLPPPPGTPGTLTVISLRRAETSPASSVVATITAGCSPVRVIVSPDGGVVWVTARGSDCLLGFSAARLRTGPARALIAAVQVGAAPVGLALVRGGTRIVVADSNRFQAPGAPASLALVSVPAALAGKPALLGYIRAGGFPREMALQADGEALFVSNFGTGQLERVTVASLP